MTKLVHVRRQPNDWRTAAYRVEDVEGIRFDRTTGGVNVTMSHEALCGYVWCDGMIEGKLAHSCEHGPPPHLIKIVIPKACNDLKLWANLAGREYREPKPLDMSPEAIQKRHNRALRAAHTRAAGRKSTVETLASAINEEWPAGRLPSGEKISQQFDVPKAVAKDARRKAITIR